MTNKELKKKFKKFMKKSGAFKAYKKNLKKYGGYTFKEITDGDNFPYLITHGFSWINTKEGYDYWKAISAEWLVELEQKRN